ncbi:hypothetical protein HF086_009952 [Spodoptera exigua]|uniref:Cytochrome p450 n=1 Tax=Spodoptera exigua TaxID=7107 RepID=A0A922M5L0_SPOEX|nr:hypothetical protein HF086_009952 [Spodoptera exigua]
MWCWRPRSCSPPKYPGALPIIGHIPDLLRNLNGTSLGLKAEDQEMIAKDYAKAIDEISKVYNKRGFNVWLYPTFIYKLSALKRKEQELITRIENIINPVIQKRRSYLQNKYTMDIDEYLSTSHVKRKLKPLLDLLLHLGDEEHVFSDIEIKEHLNTFVLASYDTTSAVLRDTMLILGTVMEVFQNEDIDKNDLPKLVYSEAVIKEVLRLYPPVSFVARNLQTDVVLWKKYAMMTLKTTLAYIVRQFHISADITRLKWKMEVILKPTTPALMTLSLRKTCRCGASWGLAFRNFRIWAGWKKGKKPGKMGQEGFISVKGTAVANRNKTINCTPVFVKKDAFETG